jgi:hypothetical protein
MRNDPRTNRYLRKFYRRQLALLLSNGYPFCPCYACCSALSRRMKNWVRGVKKQK